MHEPRTMSQHEPSTMSHFLFRIPAFAPILAYPPTVFIKGYRFLVSKWGFDAVYNEFFALRTLLFAYNNFALTDKGLLEAIGPTGLGQVTHRIGLLLARVQTGRVYDYAFFMLAGLFVAVVLTDYVIDPTGAAFLAESTELFRASSRCNSVMTPQPLSGPYCLASSWSWRPNRKSQPTQLGILRPVTTKTSAYTPNKQSATTTSTATAGYSLSAAISR